MQHKMNQGKVWTEENYKELQKMLEEGKNVNDIATTMGRNRGGVLSAIRRLIISLDKENIDADKIALITGYKKEKVEQILNTNKTYDGLCKKWTLEEIKTCNNMLEKSIALKDISIFMNKPEESVKTVYNRWSIMKYGIHTNIDDGVEAMNDKNKKAREGRKNRQNAIIEEIAIINKKLDKALSMLECLMSKNTV